MSQKEDSKRKKISKETSKKNEKKTAKKTSKISAANIPSAKPARSSKTKPTAKPSVKKTSTSPKKTPKAKFEFGEIKSLFEIDFSILSKKNLALNMGVIFSKKSELAAEESVGSSVIVSSRVRLARNIVDEKFLKASGTEDKTRIFWKCANAISKTKSFRGGILYRMDELSEDEKNAMSEDRLISKELAQLGAGAGVYVSKTGNCGVMVNEEDHLRINATSQNLSLEKLWKTVDAIDDDIEKFLPYAFDAKLGYLTACPTNLGTGMRASVMLHLPALVITENMEKIMRALNQLGATVRGFLGEGSEPCGSFFQLSNQITLGKSEGEIISKMETLAKKVREFETNARRKLMRENPLILADKIERARALLSSCKLISSGEALSALSMLMMAADIGCMNGKASVQAMDFLMKFIQPSSLSKNLKAEIPSADLRDAVRAKFLNEAFSK